MKTLITGGAGFIGSHIQDALINLGHEVLIVDSLRSGKVENLNAKSKFENLDIRDKEKLLTVFRNYQPNIVFHLAAQNEVPYSMDHPDEDHDINIEGTINILEGCKLAGSKIVFSNTGGALYGDVDSKDLPLTEDHPIKFPSSFYGTSKLSAEQYIKLYGNIYKIPWVSLRYANVYGPRQDGNREAGIVAVFTARLVKDEIPTINGSGEHTRDYVFVKDIVAANIKAMDYSENDYFNISTGIGTSNQQVYDTLAKILNISSRPNYGPARAGDVLHNTLSPKKANDILGWKHSFSFEEGATETVNFYRKPL